MSTGIDASRVKGLPFSAVVQSTFDQKLADGNSIHGTVQYHIARDASGKTLSELPEGCVWGEDGHYHERYQEYVYDPDSRTSERWETGNSNLTVTITHFLPLARRPEAESAAMQTNAATARPSPEVFGMHVEKLGTQSFHGVLAEGTRTTQTVPAGEQGNALPLATVTEVWISKDSAVVMKRVYDNARTGRIVAEVVEFNQGDPPPTTFAPPEGYRVIEQTTKTIKEQTANPTGAESSPPAQ